MKISTRIRIRILFGPGSGSTFSKCGSEDPDPDPLLRKGGSEDPDPDPLFPNVDPRIRIRIRIHVKMRWIRNAAKNIGGFRNVCTYRIKDKNKKGNTLVGAELISVIYLAI